MSEILHIELTWDGDKILSVCDKKEECHQEARYWMQWSNFRRVEVYCSINNIAKIENKKHFTNLLACRIVQTLTRT